MPANTAIHSSLTTAQAALRAQSAAVSAARGKKRYLFSTLRDRRSLREIGGMGAYLTQVRWSLWWALRD